MKRNRKPQKDRPKTTLPALRDLKPKEASSIKGGATSTSDITIPKIVNKPSTSL
jgi:hypothetical protein